MFVVARVVNCTMQRKFVKQLAKQIWEGSKCFHVDRKGKDGLIEGKIWLGVWTCALTYHFAKLCCSVETLDVLVTYDRVDSIITDTCIFVWTSHCVFACKCKSLILRCMCFICHSKSESARGRTYASVTISRCGDYFYCQFRMSRSCSQVVLLVLQAPSVCNSEPSLCFGALQLTMQRKGCTV